MLVMNLTTVPCRRGRTMLPAAAARAAAAQRRRATTCSRCAPSLRGGCTVTKPATVQQLNSRAAATTVLITGERSMLALSYGRDSADRVVHNS